MLPVHFAAVQFFGTVLIFFLRSLTDARVTNLHLCKRRKTKDRRKIEERQKKTKKERRKGKKERKREGKEREKDKKEKKKKGRKVERRKE